MWTLQLWASQVMLVVKNLPVDAGDTRDMGLIPGSGRPPGGEHGNPLQCSCLENTMHRGSGTSLKATLWMKAQHEGALTPSCILRKKPKVPLTARQMVCYPVNNSRGKWSSIPPHKTRPDSPVPTLQGPCGRSFKWRGTLRFLPQLEMRTFAIAPNPVEFRERLPSPQYA